MSTQTENRESGIIDAISEVADQPKWMKVLANKETPSDDYSDAQLIEMINNARFDVQLAMPLTAYMIGTTKTYITRSNTFTAYAQYDHSNRSFHMNFSADMFVSLDNDKQRAFLMAHELLHVMLEHGPMSFELSLAKESDKKRLHHAMDYFINLACNGVTKSESGELQIDKKLRNSMELVEGGLYDEKYAGMSVLEIYEELKKDSSYDNDDSSGSINGGGVPLEDLEDMIGQACDEIRAKSEASARLASGGAGIGTGSCPITDAICKRTEPVVDLSSRLHAVCTSSGSESVTYAELNNRYSSEVDIVMPSRVGNRINLFIGYDTSGSMSDEDLKDVACVVHDVVTQYENWQITLASCDTSTHIVGTYDGECAEDFKDINLEMVSRGGTDMAPLADTAANMAELGEEIDACIIVTDGYIPTEVDYHFSQLIENLVIVTKNGNQALNLQNAEVIKLNGEVV